MSPTVGTERVTPRTQTTAARADRLGRFSPTPLTAALRAMGRTLTLETNSATVLRQARRAFEPYGLGSFEQSEFLWRIVGEPCEQAPDMGPDLNAIASETLRLAQFGRRGFFAVDLDAREAVACIPETLAADESAFCGVFLAALFQSTAPALRLTQLSAACLARGGKGLLLFGPSQHQLAEVGRLASRLGLELHSDHAVFIDLAGGNAKAWGQWGPNDFKQPLGSVTPVLSVFLEPEDLQVPLLTPLPAREYLRRLCEEGMGGAPYPDDREATARALGRLPAYRLAYGRDPGAAAVFLHSMLRTHNLLEAQS